MEYSFEQGWLDSLCGVYSIVNAEKIINGSTDEESQRLFNQIIEYLSKKRMLKEAVINGIKHSKMISIMNDVIGDRIPERITNKKNIYKLSEWWQISQEYMQIENRAIILSLDGREDHFTVVKYMTDKVMTLSDSGGIKTIRKSTCKLKGYEKEDKYVIFPSQCFYLGKGD